MGNPLLQEGAGVVGSMPLDSRETGISETTWQTYPRIREAQADAKLPTRLLDLQYEERALPWAKMMQEVEFTRPRKALPINGPYGGDTKLGSG